MIKPEKSLKICRTGGRLPIFSTTGVLADPPWPCLSEWFSKRKQFSQKMKIHVNESGTVLLHKDRHAGIVRLTI